MEEYHFNLLGGGGYGTVYSLSEKKVVKAMHGEKNCQDAKLEFIKQQKIYDSFERLKSIKTNNELILMIQKVVKVSKPLSFNANPVIINNTMYSCMFVMEKLKGLPISFYLDEHPQFKRGFTSNFNFDVQGHLALSGQFLNYGFYPVNVNQLISNNNPLRGYFITENDTLLNQLPWSVNTLKTIIGFIYGWIYYNADIVPLDVEITVGLEDEDFVINVIDFGLTFDLSNINNNLVNTTTQPFFDRFYQQGDLEQLMIESLSLDFYCDFESDEVCRDGFDLAKKYNM